MLRNYEEKNSIELLIEEIEKALNAELYLIALMTSLTMPDVMCKLEYGKGGRDNYIKWVDNYIADGFGVKYGDREKIGKYDKNEETNTKCEKTDNEKYLESPTSMCGENCYQLRCSLLHDVNNELKSRNRGGKRKIFTWIDECVLQFTKEEFTNGIMSGYDTYLKELQNGEIVTVAEKFCYINVKELCHDIIRGAKEYIKTKNVSEKMPKLKINNGGGKIMSSLDPKIEMNNWRLFKKHMNNNKLNKIHLESNKIE